MAVVLPDHGTGSGSRRHEECPTPGTHACLALGSHVVARDCLQRGAVVLLLAPRAARVPAHHGHRGALRPRQHSGAGAGRRVGRRDSLPAHQHCRPHSFPTNAAPPCCRLLAAAHSRECAAKCVSRAATRWPLQGQLPPQLAFESRDSTSILAYPAARMAACGGTSSQAVAVCFGGPPGARPPLVPATACEAGPEASEQRTT